MKVEGGAYARGEGGGRNMRERRPRVGAHRVERRCGRGVLLAEGDDSSGQGQHGAEMGVAGAAVPDGFVADPVFLLRERKGDKRGGEKVVRRAGEMIQGARADPEVYIAKTEHGRARGAQVFAGAEEEKETKHETVRCGARKRGGFGVGRGPHQGDHIQGQGFHARGGFIIAFPSLE